MQSCIYYFTLQTISLAEQEKSCIYIAKSLVLTGEGIIYVHTVDWSGNTHRSLLDDQHRTATDQHRKSSGTYSSGIVSTSLTSLERGEAKQVSPSK